MMLCDWQIFWHEHRQRPVLGDDECLSPEGEVVPRFQFQIVADFSGVAAALRKLGDAMRGLRFGTVIPGGDCDDQWPDVIGD